MSEKKYKILIADYKNADVSANVPYLFKKAGCEVEVFCSSQSWLLKNRNWDIWHNVVSRNHFDYSRQLQRLIQDNNYDDVVLTDDYVIRIMNDTITDQIVFKKILPISDINYRDILGSKSGLSFLCEQCNILTPTYYIYDGVSNPLLLANNITFPLLLKVDKSGGGKGVFFISSEQELEEVLFNLSEDKKINLVFQKYITGDNIAVEALFKEGKLLGYITSKVIKNIRNEFSISMTREYEHLPELGNILKKIGEAWSLNGFSSMTFMRSQGDGQYYLVEADMRPHDWFYLAKFCGVNFSELIKNYLDKTLSEVSLISLQNKNPIILHHFSRSLKWAIKHGDLISILRWLFNIDRRWRLIPWHDRLLLKATMADVLKTCLYDVAFLRPLMRNFRKTLIQLKVFLPTVIANKK
jgi:hypothetical protein